MDTSIGKALIMIAGVLLAMLVIGFVTQTFNQTSQWASAEDEEKVIEEIQKFNKEWEVYDKDLMYGVDVISCLNKARSNNDKISSGELDKDYEITVEVKLKSDELSESMIVYHISNNYSEKEVEYGPNDGPQTRPDNYSKKLSELNFKFLKTTYVKLSGTIFSNISMPIKTTSSTIKLNKVLTLNQSTPSDSDIVKLLSASDAVSQTIKNTDDESRNNVNGWTKVEFKSALYDLKTRKFKCTGITYKADSGRVDKITFVEM